LEIKQAMERIYGEALMSMRICIYNMNFPKASNVLIYISWRLYGIWRGNFKIYFCLGSDIISPKVERGIQHISSCLNEHTVVIPGQSRYMEHTPSQHGITLYMS